jgi:hypothetical protein
MYLSTIFDTLATSTLYLSIITLSLLGLLHLTTMGLFQQLRRPVVLQDRLRNSAAQIEELDEQVIDETTSGSDQSEDEGENEKINEPQHPSIDLIEAAEMNGKKSGVGAADEHM